MLDLSPALKTQSRLGTILDLSLSDNGLGNSLTTYLLSCKVEDKTPSTLDSYSQRLGTFSRFIAQRNLANTPENITVHHIRLFMLSLKEHGLETSTIDAYYRSLRTFFNWLVSEGIIRSTPMANIKKPRLPKKLIRPFSTQGIQRMRMLTSGNRFADVRNRAVILLLLDTGIRLNELSHIQLKDIDFDRETVRIYGKGNKERMVRIGRNTQKALLRYLLARHDEYPCLWLNVSRRPISRDGIQTAVEKLCKSAEITNAKPGPHTFRHAAAIIFLRNGGDSSILQYMLGHSSFDMTRRYLSTLGERELVAAHKKANPVDNMRL